MGHAPGVPWWVRMAAKLVLARLPLGYGVWQRFGLFRHGAMDHPPTAVRLFEFLIDLAGQAPPLDGRVVLELGPGDAVAAAVIGRAMGAQEVVLVDVGAFARRDLGCYRALARHLADLGHDLGDVADAPSFEVLLARCRARYLTRGLQDLRALPTGITDLQVSNAVLEHIRLHEMDAVLGELRRLMASEGCGGHVIDFSDHLAGANNNLRFSQPVWEAGWMARSGFYTNRIAPSDMLARLRAAGFEVSVRHALAFGRDLVPADRLDPAFAGRDDADRTTATLQLGVRPI